MVKRKPVLGIHSLQRTKRRIIKNSGGVHLRFEI